VVVFLAGATAFADDPSADAPAPDAPPAYQGDREAARPHFEQGEVAFEEMRWTEAANAYWKALQEDLTFYVAHTRYQDAARRAGDQTDQTATEYDKLVADSPEVAELALHRLRLVDCPQRLERLEGLRKASPKDPNVLLEIGRATLVRGDASAAAKTLADAARLAGPERRDILLLQAEALLQAGSLTEARKLLEPVADADPQFWHAILLIGRLDLREGRHLEAASRARTVLSLRPSYVAAFLLAAEGLLRGEQREEAQQMLASAERVNGEAADVQVALGDVKARLETDQYFAEALAHYGNALTKRPGHPHALYGTAWVLERQKKHDEAEKKYREYLDVVPNSPEAINSIGFCLLKQGRVSEAQRQFQRAVDLDENYVTARANLGATYDAQSKYAEAIKIYEKILEMKGQRENLRVLVNCAFDYESLGSYPKAAKLLEQAHGIKPKDPDIMVWLGDNMYFQKKWKDAEEWYQKALAIDENHFFAWRGMGFAMAQRKRWADSVAAFEKASRAKPENLELYLIIGDLYLDELDNPEAALKAYQQYIQQGGTDPAIPDIIQEIEKDLQKK